MITYRLISSALLVSAIALPVGFAAETSPGASDANQPYQRTSGDVAVRRVSDEALKQDITAKDFLGKSVYDPAGEKLGDIADVHLSARPTGESARESNRSDRANADGSERAAGRWAEENVVYISVGGLMGMGDSIVSAPTASLQFDATKDRFTLNVRKADFVAIAKQEVPAYVSSRTDASPSYAGPTRPDTASESADAATQVKTAIQSDQTVGKLAPRINVSESGGSVVLSGNVERQSEKDRIILVARAATTKPVTDRITIANNP